MKTKRSKQSYSSTKAAYHKMKLLLVKTMEERPRLSANQLCPALPSVTSIKKEWLEVAQVLNTSGIIKNHQWTAFGARKKWSDLKYKARKKAFALERMKEEGKDIPPHMKLKQLERRILALARQQTYPGEPTPSTSSQNDDPTCRITRNRLQDRTEQESHDPESPEQNDSSSDCSMDVPDHDRVENNGSMDVPDHDNVENNGSMDVPDHDRVEKNDTTINTSRLRENGKFEELFSLQRSKLDIRKEELLIKKEKLELKKQEIELMKKQLTVQTNTLNQLKAMCKLMEKKENINV